jgi:EAL domain-containing protein (putative c-di-GMP-specific phosphodiesterase class I)
MEQDLHQDAAFWQATLDSLTAQVAVLDGQGRILAVNAAWRRFAVKHGLSDPDGCLGRGYLEVCELLLGRDGDREKGSTAADRIRRVLSGETPQQAIVYPSRGPNRKQWFRFRVTRLAGSGPARVVVTRENVSAMKAAEVRARRLAAQLRRSQELEKRFGQVWLESRSDPLTVLPNRQRLPGDGSAAAEPLRDRCASRRPSGRPGVGSAAHAAFACAEVENVRQNRASETASPPGKRLEIARRLDGAAERGEFRLAYQPQLTLARKLVGLEALLRWSSPQLGPVSPAVFIPVAEESGLIGVIDSWVLRHAFQQACQWQRRGARVRTAINLSATEFSSPDFVDLIRQLLRETGADPGLIELEITEGVAMQNPEMAVAQIDKLRALGLRTAIDDFGAGYSSLSYLRLLPVHSVKIDRSFLQELPTAANALPILGAVIDLAHQLRLEVIIEGVETDSQLRLLAPLRPDLIQGFLFYRPMPPHEAEKLLWPEANQPERDWTSRAPAPNRYPLLPPHPSPSQRMRYS